MKVKQTFGGALCFGAAAALCTTGIASATCDSVLIYDNGYPVLSTVVESQVGGPNGDPAGADDFDVAGATEINDLHWYTGDDSDTGINFSGDVRVTVYGSLAGCGGPDSGNVIYQDDVPAARTVLAESAIVLGGVQSLDFVRYDVTKIEINLSAAGKYWISLQPISSAVGAESYWLTTRTEFDGDTLVGCGAYSDEDGVSGFSLHTFPAESGNRVDLNFQLTRCLSAGSNPSADIGMGPPQAEGSDGIVNLFDLLVLIDNWGTNGAGANIATCGASLNNVDLFDLITGPSGCEPGLIDQWGNTGGPSESNDECEFAILLIGTGDYNYDGTGATPDGPDDSCMSDAAPDVWYCWKSECGGFTDFSTLGNFFMAVYETGPSCSGTELGAPVLCVGPNDFGRLATAPGTHYKIRINAAAEATGTFNISECQINNDTCDDAIVLFSNDGTSGSPDLYSGSLLGTTSDDDVPQCPDTAGENPNVLAGSSISAGDIGTTPGVWFVNVGSGKTHIASTKANGGTSSQDDYLIVFCGRDCESFEQPCLGSSIDTGAPGANVQWCTVPNVLYFIYYGVDPDNAGVPGDYTISMLKSSAPFNCTAVDGGADCVGLPTNVCTIDVDDDAGPGCQGAIAGGFVLYSDNEAVNIDQRVADNFVPTASGSITEVCWYGLHFDPFSGANCSQFLTATFRVTIYEDVDGTPSNTPLHSAIYSLDYNDADNNGNGHAWTGGQLFLGAEAVDYQEHTVQLTESVSVTEGNCYWVECVRQNGTGTCVFSYVGADFSGLGQGDGRCLVGDAANEGAGGYDALNDQFAADVHFCVSVATEDEITTKACPLPDPFMPVLCTLNGYFQNPQGFTVAGVSDNDLTGNLSDPQGTPTPIVRADDLEPDVDGNITAICWWGIYREFDGTAFNVCAAEPTTGGEEEFIITYYDSDPSNQDLPLSIIGGPFTVNPTAGQRADSGLTFGDPASTVWEWSVTHGAVAVTAGEKYWVSIVGNTSGAANECTFLWVEGSGAIGAPTGNGFSAIGDGTIPSFGFDTIDLAWAINLTGNTPSVPPPPANNTCAGAAAIATTFIDGGAGIVDNTLATPLDGGADDPDLPVGSPSCQWNGTPDDAHHTIWFTATVPASGTLRIEACTEEANAANTMNDSTIAIFTGTCGSLVEVGCGEDNCTGASPWYSCAEATGLTPGETVYICIMNPGSWDGDEPGALVINLHSTAGCP